MPCSTCQKCALMGRSRPLIQDILPWQYCTYKIMSGSLMGCIFLMYNIGGEVHRFLAKTWEITRLFYFIGTVLFHTRFSQKMVPKLSAP